jgi:16S rRNA (cytidine1402-2'-O)-methyltransferase
METGTLYLIPAPLGESTSVTFDNKTLAIIGSLNQFIVENSRTARRYLKKLNYPQSLDKLTLFELNTRTGFEEFGEFIAPLLDGKNMGLLSEAGCPGVADPGADIVKICHEKNIKVVPFVGPSSILLAMMSSGLNGQNFAFNGYLPISQPQRTRQIRDLESISAKRNQAQIFIETPYRNGKLLEELLKICRPATLLSIAIDLTLPTEFIKSKSILDWKKSVPNLQKRPAIFIIQGQ